MSLLGLFARGQGSGLQGPGRQAPDERRQDRERVKAWARDALAQAGALPPGTELTASEIECLDPACPGTETVILVMTPGRRTRAVKIGKGAAAIVEQDVRLALVEAIEEDRA